MKSKALIRVISFTLIVTIVGQLSAVTLPLLRNWLDAGPRLYVALFATWAVFAELLCLAGLWFFLRSRGRSFADLGLWKRSPARGWIFGIALGLFTAGSGLLNLGLNWKSPLAALLNPAPWHVYSALVLGLGAGFCEEIMFRGFIMGELADAGYGRALQVVVSGILFGVIHIGLLRAGLVRGLAVIIPTAALGMIYSLVYLSSRRSLMPSIVSHFINDAVVMPLLLMAEALAVAH